MKTEPLEGSMERRGWRRQTAHRYTTWGGGWSDRTDPSAAGPGSTAKLGGKCARNTLGFTNKQGQIDMI